MRNKALGKGLSALIPGAEYSGDEVVFMEIDIASIRENPYQPREQMDAESLKELADSIRENGVIQPVAVCKRDGAYQLISGARRLKAAKLAGLRTIPAVMMKIDSDEQLLELALVENLQREDLNPMELAAGYKRLMDECGLTQEQIAQKVGKGRPTVANTLRLLKLPRKVQDAVRRGELSAGHARTLAALEDEQLVLKLFKRSIREGISVRKLEKLVASTGKSKSHSRLAKSTDPHLEDIEYRLRSLYSTKVSIHKKGKGGIIEFSYFSDEELERLLELLESIRDV